MRTLLAGVLMMTLGARAREISIVIRGEDGHGLPGAEVEAVLTPREDPRLASVVTRTGVTDGSGRFRFAAEDRLILTRVRAKQTGCFSADVDHRHGLGRATQPTELALTLPRMTEGVPLHYRDVRLVGLPSGRRIGFDAEAADAVAPWGKGRVTDWEFLIEAHQVGWLESPEALAELRRTPEGRRMDDQEWAETYGRFRGTLRVSLPKKGDGLRESPAFWPYCRLKMPALAPTENYAPEMTFAFDTLPTAAASSDLTGYYLRLRTQDDEGKTSAHYAKIHGRIEAGPGRVAFRFYYNPRADDRRLAFAPGRNLLHPGPATTPIEQTRYETSQP
jgi:hypothetical protein